MTPSNVFEIGLHRFLMPTANQLNAISPYAELHCLTNFSFLRGASHPEELVARALMFGYSALAITDECSVAGVVRAYLAARGTGLKILIGSELTLDDELKLVLLVTDRATYGNLCELITAARRAAEKGGYRATRGLVERFAPGLLALWLPGEPWEPDCALEQARWLKHVFPDRGWIAVELLLNGRDGERLTELAGLATHAGVPLVAAGGVEMHKRGRRALHDVLTATRLGITVQTAGLRLRPNGERSLRARERLARIYPCALLEETVRVAERCHFSLEELRYEYPEEIVPAGQTPSGHLRQLTEEGLRRRWPRGVPAGTRKLIEHELALIAELRYEPYFLTVHDIVRFARSQGILCQGRGSAANSAVCFALGITEVDPDRIDTLFERFVSKERDEPPDIDVDFEHERREEVVQYIYGKYGRHRAALAATVITYRTRSAVRDAGRALGFSLEQVDRLSKNLQWWDGQLDAPRLTEAGFDPDNPMIRRLAALVRALRGFPRHLSQHVGGFVIARDRLSRLVPIENAAMDGRTVIQWDKDDLDALGLLKVDVLALGMLTAIRKTLDCIRGGTLTLSDIPAEDPAVYRMIQQADTIGVFQIESRAQMSMLPRLKPACFYDLVVEVAIVRPGPIQGGMVHPYLRRRQQLEPVSYPSEEVKAVLARTLGVPIFQEQVIKLAVVAAGFTPGEADTLRRAMATFRRRGGMDKFEQRLIDGMRSRGYKEEFARQIYRQILGFGEYGFPESHSASFALLAYASAWLKCHEPAAFLCGLLNSQPMGFYTPSQLVQDARRHGVEVRPVDVRCSEWDCVLQPASRLAPQDGAGVSSGKAAGLAVRLGLRMVSGLSHTGAERIVAARVQAPLRDVDDLARRAALNRRDLDALSTAGALAGMAGHRHRARWAVAGVEPSLPLFQDLSIAEAPPPLRAPTEGEDIVADYASVGLTLRRHPLALLRARLARMRIRSSAQVRQAAHGEHVHTAGIVVGRQRPGTASGVIFVTLEDESGNVNVVVWNSVSERQRRELLHARLLGVVGEVQREGRVVHVVAHRLEDHSALLGRLTTSSRDFR
jgi:error-prone DNA polymerase